METTTAAARARKSTFPFLDLHEQFSAIRGEVLQAVEAVLDSQQFILGQQVDLFEQELAAYLDTSFAIGCASGTDALYLALLAQGVGPGDEVITTPFTFIATAGSIARIGATPVFVDIRPDTFNLNPGLVEQSITDKTRAILPVTCLASLLNFGQSFESPQGMNWRSSRTPHRPLVPHITATRWAASAISDVSASSLQKIWGAPETEGRSRQTTLESPTACGCCVFMAAGQSITMKFSAPTVASIQYKPPF